jgi:WD40 repeat protein
MTLEFQPLFRLKGHRDSLYSLSADRDDDHLLSAGGDGLIARWSLASDADATLVAKVANTVYSMLVIDDQLLAGTRDGNIHLIDLVANRETKLFHWNKAAVFALQQFDGGWLSGHGDGRLLRWEAHGQDARIIAQHIQPDAPLRALANSGQLLAAAYSDNHIRLFNGQLQEISRLEGHTNSVFTVLFLNEGKYILSGGRDAFIRVWEVASGKLLESIPAHLATINQLLALPELQLVATAGRDKSVKLWDAQTLELKKVVDYGKFPGLAHSHSINRLFWSSKHQALWSAGDDRLVIKYNIAL